MSAAQGGPGADYGEAPLADALTDGAWKEFLRDELAGPTVKRVEAFLKKEKGAGKKIFPPRADVFSAFNVCPLDSLRLVILGQDPYHDDGQGHGMCFSVRPGVAIPPSLRNIYKELTADIDGFRAPSHGYLEAWAQQGVLLLNATLTVQAHEANSHAKCGWQDFTDAVIHRINAETEGVVFLLWGGFARKKSKMIDRKRHRVVEAAHPSPLSARYFTGCKCFSEVNTKLEELSKDPIDWSLPRTVS
jgi:uracil-DNA glycosylase